MQEFRSNVLGGEKETSESRKIFREAIVNVVIMLSPFTPHFCDELWQEMGNEGNLFYAKWPEHVEDLTVADEVVTEVFPNSSSLDSISVGDSKNPSYLPPLP